MATDPNFTYFKTESYGYFAVPKAYLEAYPELLTTATLNGEKVTGLQEISAPQPGVNLKQLTASGLPDQELPSIGINPIDPNAPSQRTASGTYDATAGLVPVEGGYAAPGTEKQYPQTTQNPAGTPAPAPVPSNLPAQTTALQGAQGATDSPTAPTAPISTGGGGGGFNTMAGLPAQAGAIAPIAPTLPSFTGGSGGTPVTPANSADAFLQAYLQSLSPTSAETGLQSQGAALEAQLRNLNQGQGVMNANLEDQPIALPFITGQESAVEKRYALQRGDVMNQQLTVQQKLALEQAKRQSAIDVRSED